MHNLYVLLTLINVFSRVELLEIVLDDNLSFYTTLTKHGTLCS